MWFFCITDIKAEVTRRAVGRYAFIRNLAAGIYLVGVIFYRLDRFVLFQNAVVGKDASVDTRFKRKLSFANVLDGLPNRTYLVILFYSFLRFVVFALQYVLIWQALQVDIPWWKVFGAWH